MKRKVQVIRKITILMVFGILLSSSFDSYAQDKNLLAKVAYENAEKAFEAGNISEAYDELKRVDELLGKLTPKSQFLRVQIWKAYADRNSDNIIHALDNCERYLALSKSFSLPEEKQMEVIRTQQMLEKEKEAVAKRKLAAEAKKAYALVVIDSLYTAYKFKPGLTEEEFMKLNPEAFQGLKRRVIKEKNEVRYYKKDGFFGPIKTEGPQWITIKNGIVESYRFVIKYSKSETVLVSYFKAFIKSMKEALPAENYYNRYDDHIKLYKSPKDNRSINYQRRIGGELNYVEVTVE